MLSKLIQRQVPIGSKVIFWLKNGREISGELIELGRDHITLENENGVATILVEMIGAWEVVTSEMADRPDKTESGLPVTDTSSEAVTQADVTISASSIPAESLQPVLKKLIEIEARLEAQLQTARIELEEPDFFLPISRMSKRTHKKIEEAWNRVVNRYQYAKKINELSKKFGRIQSIVAELESLAEILPNSATVKRHLAYCYFLAGREKEAFNCYKMTATISREAADWYNLAVIALRSGQNPIAVYALEQWFLQRPITERPNTWYVYVNLLRSNGNYSLLRSLCENIGRDQTEQELVLLLETGIFLLKSIKKDATIYTPNEKLKLNYSLQTCLLAVSCMYTTHD